MAAGCWSDRQQFAICFGSRLNLFIWLSIYHLHYIINLASAAGVDVFQMPPQHQAAALHAIPPIPAEINFLC